MAEEIKINCNIDQIAVMAARIEALENAIGYNCDDISEELKLADNLEIATICDGLYIEVTCKAKGKLAYLFERYMV